MTTFVRWFLLLEAAVFGSAALIHAGILMSGYEYRAARTAESVIALVLLAASAGTVIAPQSSRGIGLGAQAFALLGTAVGMFTIGIGVGPRTALDVTLRHGAPTGDRTGSGRAASFNRSTHHAVGSRRLTSAA